MYIRIHNIKGDLLLVFSGQAQGCWKSYNAQGSHRPTPCIFRCPPGSWEVNNLFIIIGASNQLYKQKVICARFKWRDAWILFCSPEVLPRTGINDWFGNWHISQHVQCHIHSDCGLGDLTKRPVPEHLYSVIFISPLYCS